MTHTAPSPVAPRLRKPGLPCAQTAIAAAVAKVCTGVSLPPSAVSNIIGLSVLPLTNTLDSTLGSLQNVNVLVNPLEPGGTLGNLAGLSAPQLNTGLTTALNNIASGRPIGLQAVDTGANAINLLGDPTCKKSSLSDLLPGRIQKLDQLVGALRGSGEFDQVTLTGHTNRIGSDAYNLSLSRERASTVRDYLIAKCIPAQRITATGLGEAVPLIERPQRSHAVLVQCLKPNRRVEIENW